MDKISNIIEKKIKAFESDEYFLWKIRKNWIEIVSEEIANEIYPQKLKDKTLIVSTNNSLIYNEILISLKKVIIERINIFLGLNKISEIEVNKVNRKIRRIFEKSEILEKTEDEDKKKKNQEEDKDILKKIKLTKSEEENIRKNILKIEEKYSEISEKLEKIAINRKKKDIYLLLNGYKKCIECGDIFYPSGKELFCFSCNEKRIVEKENMMKQILMKNPYIGEQEAVKKIGATKEIYYKMREKLAQEMYNEMFYYMKEKNIEIEENREYSDEIRKEALEEFELYMRMYVDYKIGTDNEEIYNIERKKTIRKLKKEISFKK